MTDMVELFSDETISDLNRDHLRLIQPQNGFRFGEDTVLLADFAARLFSLRPEKKLRVADLGAGSGASSILLAARLPKACVLAVEMDAHGASLIERNRQLNQLEDRLEILHSDYSGWPGTLPEGPVGKGLRAGFDLVVANPPYGVINTGLAGDLTPGHSRRKVAREEQTMDLEALIRAAAALLRPHGQLALVHRIDRLTDVLTTLRLHRIEPKTLRLVQSVEKRPPSRFLVAAVNQARKGSLVALAPLIARDRHRRTTPEMDEIYGNACPMAPEDLFRGLSRLENPWQESGYDPAGS